MALAILGALVAGTKLPTQMELADIAGNEDAMSQLWIDNRADLGEDWGPKGKKEERYNFRRN